jgi:hypothetical protein
VLLNKLTAEMASLFASAGIDIGPVSGRHGLLGALKSGARAWTAWSLPPGEAMLGLMNEGLMSIASASTR